jgi:ubiquinone/menaquinone biosynthesis C-methylase UbiE
VRTEGVIERGVLTCPGCGSRYGIESAIARMLPGGLGDQTVVETASEEVERKRSEMAARDAQVEDYDKMRGLAMFSHIEIPVTMKMLDLQPNDLLLEAGCGTGRMTLRFAAACKDQMAVDFSFESLRVCRRKLVAAGVRNVDLVQADVCALPFRSERFDRVVSCQVLEHIPTPDSRERMISEIARTVKPGGRVVLSAYQHSLFTRLFGHKEGEHEGGIYYYRFHRPELRALLGRHLKVEQITGALVYHYLARCHRPAVI